MYWKYQLRYVCILVNISIYHEFDLTMLKLSIVLFIDALDMKEPGHSK